MFVLFVVFPSGHLIRIGTFDTEHRARREALFHHTYTKDCGTHYQVWHARRQFYTTEE